MDYVYTLGNVLKKFSTNASQLKTYGITSIQDALVIAAIAAVITALLATAHSWGFLGLLSADPELSATDELGEEIPLSAADDMLSAEPTDMLSEFVGYVGEALGDVSDSILGKPKPKVTVSKKARRSGVRWFVRNYAWVFVATMLIVSPITAFGSINGLYKDNKYTASRLPSATDGYTPSYRYTPKSSYVPTYRPFTPSSTASSSSASKPSGYTAYKPPVAKAQAPPKFVPYKP